MTQRAGWRDWRGPARRKRGAAVKGVLSDIGKAIKQTHPFLSAHLSIDDALPLYTGLAWVLWNLWTGPVSRSDVVVVGGRSRQAEGVIVRPDPLPIPRGLNLRQRAGAG